MATLANLIVRIGASTDDFDKKVNASLGKIKRFGAEMSAAGEALSIGFSLPVIAAGGFALKAAADMEKLQLSLTATMKSATAAGAEMEKLKEVAKLPGLGLQEAVQGSIRLQTMGTSADKARKIMMELGNSIAIAGGGKADFSEAIRQLSQLQATGKVTKENLDPIIERAPQIAKIMLDLWGPQAVADPAKFFEKAGIASAQFIDIITEQMSKGERAGNTFANSWENVTDSVTLASAEFGKSLMPIAKRVLDEFLTPGIQKAKALAEAFGRLSPTTQNVSLGLTGVLTVAPLVVVALGTLIEKWGILAAAVVKVTPLLKGVAAFISLAGVAATGAAAGVGLFLNFLNERRQNTIDTSAEALKKLNERFAGVSPSSKAGYDALVGFTRIMKDSSDEAVKSASALDLLAGATGKTSATIHIASIAEMAHVEALERTKAAVGKVKDMMYEYFNAGNYGAKFIKEFDVDTRAAAASADDFRLKLAQARWELTALSNMPPIHMVEPNINAFRRGSVNEVGDILGAIGGGPSSLQQAAAINRAEAALARIKQLNREGKATGNDVIAAQQALKRAEEDHGKTAKKAGDIASKAMHQVSTAITDTSRAITKLIFEGGKLKDVMKNVGLEIAKGFTQIVIEKGIRLAIKAVGNLIGDMTKLGGLFGKIFSSGASAAQTAANTGGDLGGAFKGGGAASSSMSGLTGMITAGASVVSAISGVVGNFQFAHMNTALGRIEESTRYMKIWTGEQSQSLLWCAQKTTEYMGYAVTALDAIGRFQSEMLANLQQLNNGGGMATARASNVNITINTSGGDPRAILDALTRELKQLGVIPR